MPLTEKQYVVVLRMMFDLTDYLKLIRAGSAKNYVSLVEVLDRPCMAELFYCYSIKYLRHSAVLVSTSSPDVHIQKVIVPCHQVAY